ncbi:MAG: hypothetical protein PHV16_03465 [Candidatus Nanoarchaeia archaeon]|nr:hypothetical protein [Candidatus Nanoarchaeia archaeon]
MKLERGDPNNLTGNLIAYSRTAGSDRGSTAFFMEDDIISLYLTSDKKNLVKKIEEFEMDIASTTKIFKSYNDDKSHIKTMSFYLSELYLCSEKGDLPVGIDDDLIFSGEYLTMNECDESINKVAEIYIDNLINQKTRKEYNPYKCNIKILTYQNIDKNKIQEYIISNYVVPMNRAIKQGSFKDFDDLRRKFITMFSSGYPSSLEDFIEVTNLIKKNDNGILISNYLNKISAIKNEDYEKAGQLKKEIEKNKLV